MTIKHLVLSGGGPTMIQTLGSIEYLQDNNFIHMDNIQTIYGTSAGAIVGTLLCLKYDWETINDYIIKRPWHDLFQIKVQNIFDAYTKKGIFDIQIIEKCFKPLFDAKDIPLNITLDDFYNLSKIELHFFTFEVNEFSLLDISYITHPNLLLTQAILMTCAIPVLITPLLNDNKCYIDGGLVCNYPLKYCVESGKNVDEILGFKNNYNYNNTSYINNESTILDLILSILFKTIYTLGLQHVEPKIKYEVICDTDLLTFQFLRTSLTSLDTRKELLKSGIETAKLFLSNLQNTI
jgi:predicted acylesterase/phospholipase RssA